MKAIRHQIFFLLFFLNSCAVYSPHLADVPLISAKDEARIEAGYTWYQMFIGSFSYGITKHVTLQTFINKSAGEMFYFQNAAAYYKSIGADLVMEFWGGYGFGHTDIGNHDMFTSLKGRYNFSFAQFDIGKKDVGKAHADYGFALKGGFFRSDLTDHNYFHSYPVRYMGPSEPLKINSFILEPSVFLRMGGEHLKVNFKLGACKIFQHENKDKPLPIVKVNFGLGLNYRF